MRTRGIVMAVIGLVVAYSTYEDQLWDAISFFQTHRWIVNLISLASVVLIIAGTADALPELRAAIAKRIAGQPQVVKVEIKLDELLDQRIQAKFEEYKVGQLAQLSNGLSALPEQGVMRAAFEAASDLDGVQVTSGIDAKALSINSAQSIDPRVIWIEGKDPSVVHYKIGKSTFIGFRIPDDEDDKKK